MITNLQRLGIAFTAVLLAGCSSVPETYAKDTEMPGNCGYKSEQTTTPGFALEVFSRSYSFLPIPDKAVNDAKDCFIRSANTVATKAGKKIKPILRGDINAAPTRNIMDGYYSVYATGRIVYED